MPIVRVIALVFCLTSPVLAVESAWVLDYSPPEAGPLVTRAAGGPEAPLRLGAQLQAGDVVRIAKSSRVLVGLGDGSERELSGPGSWLVPVSQASPAFIRVIQDLFGLVQREGTMAASAATRDVVCKGPTSNAQSRPAFPVGQKVVAGMQTLPLGWSGGCPPFDLEVSIGSRVIARVTQSKERQQYLRQIDLKAGSYALRVTDGNGAVDTAALMAVAQRPKPPADFQMRSRTLTRMATAAWLSDFEAGVWRLESVKALQPLLNESNPLALSLATQLMSSEQQ